MATEEEVKPVKKEGPELADCPSQLALIFMILYFFCHQVKPAKRGRGRPPKPDSEKKAAKRKAEPALDEDGNPVVKKGRGRPPGSGGKKAKKAGKPAKGVRLMLLDIMSSSHFT